MIGKNIWFICVGEPVPINGNFENLHRCGKLAHQFSLQNDVTWFTSNFDHFSKKKIDFIAKKKINKNFNLFFLDTKPYKKNISLLRFFSHYLIGKKFKKEVKSFIEKPDIIYASFPTIELAYECTKYAKNNNIPIIIDIRDLWPDIFLSAIPKALHPIAKIALLPWYLQKKYIFSNATSIIGISDYFLQFGLNSSKDRNTKLDKVILKSFDSNMISNKKQKQPDSRFEVVYLGAISKNKLDLDLVLKAFQQLDNNYHLTICGSGDDLEYYKEKSSDNVSYMGFLDKRNFSKIISRSDIGIIPLNNRFDFTTQLVNKSIEYLSFGIPILSSLDGELKKFIIEHRIGFYYSSAEELVSQIKKLKNDNYLLDNISRNASQVFLDEFDFKNNFKKFENHFLKVLD